LIHSHILIHILSLGCSYWSSILNVTVKAMCSDTRVTLYTFMVLCLDVRVPLHVMWYGNCHMFDMEGMNVLLPSSSKILAWRCRHKATLKQFVISLCVWQISQFFCNFLLFEWSPGHLVTLLCVDSYVVCCYYYGNLTYVRPFFFWTLTSGVPFAV
jgi:hypothetical protein